MFSLFTTHKRQRSFPWRRRAHSKRLAQYMIPFSLSSSVPHNLPPPAIFLTARSLLFPSLLLTPHISSSFPAPHYRLFLCHHSFAHYNLLTLSVPAPPASTLRFRLRRVRQLPRHYLWPFGEACRLPHGGTVLRGPSRRSQNGGYLLQWWHRLPPHYYLRGRPHLPSPLSTLQVQTGAPACIQPQTSCLQAQAVLQALIFGTLMILVFLFTT